MRQDYLKKREIKAEKPQQICAVCQKGNPHAALFCGSCGNKLTTVAATTTTLAHKTPTNKTFRFFNFKKFALTSLALILMISGFIFFPDSKTAIKISDKYFDIPIEHPAYILANNLIKIGALPADKNGALNPYSTITPEEWNQALKAVEAHMGFDLPISAVISEKETISTSLIQNKAKILAFFFGIEDSPITTGLSKIEALNLIEQICFVNNGA